MQIQLLLVTQLILRIGRDFQYDSVNTMTNTALATVSKISFLPGEWLKSTIIGREVSFCINAIPEIFNKSLVELLSKERMPPLSCRIRSVFPTAAI